MELHTLRGLVLEELGGPGWWLLLSLLLWDQQEEDAHRWEDVSGSAAPRAFSQAGNCSPEKGCTLHQFIFFTPSFLPYRLFQELVSDTFWDVPAWKTHAFKAMDKKAPNPAQIGLALLIHLS